jgi:hypothetical protein
MVVARRAMLTASFSHSKSELVIENALLRRQLAVLNRQVKRPKLTWRDRSIIVFLASKLRGWKDALMIVQPETLLRWHRDFFRFVWRHKSKAEANPGRPPLSDDDIARRPGPHSYATTPAISGPVTLFRPTTSSSARSS